MKKLYKTIVFLPVLLLSGCTVSMPFKGPGYDSRERAITSGKSELIVGLTYVELGDDRKLNREFWSQLWKVYESMEDNSGLVGYRVRKRLFSNKGWTMSVWEDYASLQGFAKSKPHQEAIKTSWDAVIVNRFFVVKLPADELPLSWEKAEQLLEEQGIAYN